MKFMSYLKDKTFYIISFFVVLVINLLIFRISDIDLPVAVFENVLLMCLFLSSLFYGYFRRVKYYNNLLSNIQNLDKAYLVLSTLERPEFYDGKIMYDVLYDIDKSMAENVKELELQTEDFKEYIEMWIHEVKIPLASLSLMIHNHKNDFDKDIVEQINRLDNYVEQILYFVRGENAEKDYMISKTSLKKVINTIALKNKNDLLNNKIEFEVDADDYKVETDAKWLEFILNQILNNSIKYKREKDSRIKISVSSSNDVVELSIFDNGIGIPKEDLKRVFDKSFTGYNGRIKSKSTGMGLYIARMLCKKLGHDIRIESVQNEYTKVTIIFFKNKYYEEVL